MDETGNRHSQQTDTRTENQTPHVLTHSRVLNNENTWTQRREHHTPGPIRGLGAKGEIALGEIPNADDRLMGAANLCNKPAHSTHVPPVQNLKYNKKKKRRKKSCNCTPAWVTEQNSISKKKNRS